MEIPSGHLRTLSNSTIELSVGDTSFSTSSVEVQEDNGASSYYPGRFPYSDRLMDRVVTGSIDVDIWIWMIEYLAKFQTELWMLQDVFEMGPKVPDYLGEHTNEMVAYRCLAYLFDPTPGQNNNVASGAESKVEFDLSERCESVLQCILNEIPLSDLKPGMPELSKWNLLPFIEKKRLCQPKCALELLREASCGKRYGVILSNRQETMRTDGNNGGQVTPELSGQNIFENSDGGEKSIGLDLRNGVGVSGEETDASSCKTNRCEVTLPDRLENNDELNRGTSSVDENLRAKAYECKLDAPVDNDIEHATQAEKCFDFSNNQQEGRMEVSRSADEFMALVQLHGTSDATDGNGNMEASDNVNILPIETANGITLSITGPKDLGKHPLNEDAKSDDQRKRKDQKQIDNLPEVISIDKNNLNQRETVDGCPSSPSAYRYTSKQREKAPLMVDVSAGHLSRMGIPSDDLPTLRHFTIELLAGETSFGRSNIEVSGDDDTSSDRLQSLSCSDRFRDRIVTGDLDIDIWIWMIEYLAKSKKELSTLHDVFEIAPKLPHYLGEYTNEMVAFRCLAYLFDACARQNNDVACGTGSKVEFDLSESCEHVLQCILDEIPLSDLKPGAPELLKWNLLPFIENKRLSLPKCTFELLREASRQKCTGVIPSDAEEIMGINSLKNNRVALGGQSIDERMNEEGNSCDQCPGSVDGVLSDENGTSSGKTDLCDVVIPDTFEENEDGNQDTPVVHGIFRAKAKEYKLDEADAAIDGVNECAAEAKECFDPSNNQEATTEASRSTAHDHNKFMDSGEQQGTNDADNSYGQIEASHDVSILPQTENGEEALGEYPSNEAEGIEDQEKDKDQTQMDGLYEAPARNNNNLIQYENSDGHSSSPSPYRYTCEQCNEGGKLLFCSNEGCPVMIHEKCLDSLPAHNEDGNFYCPLCSYTHDSSEYLKSKAQVAEAKKKVGSFLNLVHSKLKKGVSGNQGPSSRH